MAGLRLGPLDPDRGWLRGRGRTDPLAPGAVMAHTPAGACHVAEPKRLCLRQLTGAATFKFGPRLDILD